MSLSQAIETAAGDVLRRYRPDGNYHTPEMVDKYLGVSTLTKNPATYYAERLLEQKRLIAAYVEEKQKDDPGYEPSRKELIALFPDTGEKYWGYKGNAASDAALQDCDAWEVQGRVALGPTGWELIGHGDGYRTINTHILGYEHKIHAAPGKKHIEAATRQAILNAGLLDEMHDAGVTEFQVADFMDDPHKPKTWTWPEGASISAVLACIAVDNPEEYNPDVYPTPITKQDMQQVVEFYKKKALAIINCVENDTLSYAEEWDRNTGEEFFRPITQMNDALPDMPSVALQYKRGTVLEKEGKELKEEAKGLIMALMDKGELQKGQWCDGAVKVSIVETKERVQPAYTVSGSRYPRVTVSKKFLEENTPATEE